MATLEERLEDEEYKLWVKAGVCIDALKSGLEGFVRSRSARVHMHVKTALRNNNSVNNLCLYAHIGFDRRLKKWSLGCCPDCQVYIDELENLKVPPFTFKQANWKNTDIKKWPNEPWEMVKVFMNPGQTAAQKDPRESDLSAILNFITHCKIPRVDINDQNNIAKVLDARNQIMRSAQMKMSLGDFQRHTKAMIDLLEDKIVLYQLQDAKDAVKIIKEVQAASFCITRSDEVKALTEKTDALLELSITATAEIAELRSEQENIRSFVNSDIKQSEALVKNKTDDRQEALDNLTKEKEKPVIVRKPQSDDKGMTRKLLSPGSPTHNNNDDDAHELPAEILRMDNKSVDLFKKALEDGKERDYNIRIMVVGPFGVGKTTFTNRLLCQDIDMNERNSTDGIDVHVGKCKVSLNTMDWTVEPGDTTDVNALKRLAKILKSTRKSGDDQALEKNTITVSKQEEIRTNEGDRAIVEDETVKQNRSSAYADIDSAVCLNDSDTMDSQQYQEDLLMKDLKEIVEAGDTGEDGDNAIVSLWDFGGQFVFYTTHQMFLSRRAIYILVTNLSQHIDDLVTDDVPYFDCSDQRSHRIEEFIDIWLNSIHGHSTKNDKEPPVLLVGTHADKLKPDHKEEQIEAMFDAIRNRFAGKDASLHFIDEDFGLSNATKDRKFDDLRKKIIDVAKAQSHWGELKPAKWIPVEKLLEGLRRNGIEILNRTTMEDLNSKLPVPISDDDELDLFLRFQHDIANIMYFSLPELRDKIVLSPQFLVNALKTLITAKEFVKKKPEVLESWLKFSQQGLLKPTLLDAVWKNTRFEENRDHLLALMEHLNIIARPVTYAENKEAGDCNKTQEQEYFLVPCMLKESPPLSFFQYEESFNSTPCLCLELGQIAFPSAIFNRLLCACISQWPIAKKETKYLMYCGCGQFEVDGQHRLALSCSSNIIGLRIVRFCTTGDPDGTVCKEVYSVVKRILQRIGHGLSLKISYKEFVKCPLGRKDSFECRHAVEKVRDSDEFPCHGHTDVGILRRSELLKCWFDSNEFDQQTVTEAKPLTESLNKSSTEEPTGTPEWQSLDAEPNGQSDDQSLDAKTDAHPDSQSLDGELDGQADGQSLVVEPDGQPGGQSLAAEPDGQSLAVEPDGQPVETLQEETPITQEHINHARLCNALVTTCAEGLREILLNHVPMGYNDIYSAILANQGKLMRRLKEEQINLIFPDPNNRYTGTVDQFDITLLYVLIRNVSSVQEPPITRWGGEPDDQPRDTSIGASVERIRLFRNKISGHSVDGRLDDQSFEAYWNEIGNIMDDIEKSIGDNGFRDALEKRKKQAITPNEAKEMRTRFDRYQAYLQEEILSLVEDAQNLGEKLKNLQAKVETRL